MTIYFIRRVTGSIVKDRISSWLFGYFFFSPKLFIDRVYFTKDKINKFLKYCNYRKIIHLQRGVPTDLNEKVFNDQSLKKFYGEGEIRLIAKK